MNTNFAIDFNNVAELELTQENEAVRLMSIDELSMVGGGQDIPVL